MAWSLFFLSSLLATTIVAHRDDREIALRFVVMPPASTPADAQLFIAGNAAEFGAWRPDGVRLARDAEGKHRTTVVLPRGTSLELKVTRGTWATVEKSSSGVEVANRKHTASADATLEIVVAAWADQTARASTITGSLERHDGFGVKSGLISRAILVWLPPGYAERNDLRCPVVYIHDGQNLFDAATAFQGVEWRVDETCDRLIRARTIAPVIVVGIENTRERIAEYTPVASDKLGGGRASQYARMMLDEVKPFVDAHYRTRPESRTTFVAGSSLGGLVSLWMAKQHADVFGGAAALSPSLTWADEWLRKECERTPWKRPARLWIDMGTLEAASPATSQPDAASQLQIAALRRFATMLEQGGLRRDVDFTAREIEGARHHEAAWAARLEDALRFLLGS